MKVTRILFFPSSRLIYFCIAVSGIGYPQTLSWFSSAYPYEYPYILTTVGSVQTIFYSSSLSELVMKL
jgi:hypothetical protein